MEVNPPPAATVSGEEARLQIDFPESLPISSHAGVIIQALQQNQVLVITGDTGSGKTTQLPKMCLAAGLGRHGLIGCTQPRRIAAMAVAERVGKELASPGSVGYRIRFSDQTGPQCRIKFMTDGILLAESRQDRLLRAYEVLIIDEAHERSLNIDFLLGMLRGLLQKRPDLKLIIASATIDTERFSHHFGGAPVIQVAGRGYPITYGYSPVDEDDSHVTAAIRETVTLCDSSPGGDILIFLPTERDIRDTVSGLDKFLGDQCDIMPLFGRLQAADQRRIFNTSQKRKIIVATNVAETSITVPRIRFVVDSGLARISRYNSRAGTTSLRVERISRASCDQRAGRCGRTGPGLCIRLYSEDDYLSRDDYSLPEIQRANLAAVILQMRSLDLGDVRKFPFIDPPPGRSISSGLRSLQELGALDSEQHLTPIGRTMARLPMDPAISRIIIEAARRGALREIKVIASALAIQDPRVRPAEQEARADQAHERFRNRQSDFLSLYSIWNLYHQVADQVGAASRLRKFCTSHYLSWQRMREWLDIHEQIERILSREPGFQDNGNEAGYGAIHQSLASGFLRNIALKKQKNIYIGSGGQDLMLFPGSGLFDCGGQWIMAGELMETSRLFARCAANIDPGWLEELGGELCKRSWSDPHFEKKSGQIVAMEKVTLFGLPIVSGRRINYGRINRDTEKEARSLFIEQALVQGQMAGRYEFLEHNLLLVRELEEQEHRFRDQRFTVRPEVVAQFYAERLGRVYDRFTLNRFLKQTRDNSRLLFMRQEDICQEQPGTDALYRFPASLPGPAGPLALHYHFEPGHPDDGVTVIIPCQLVREIDLALFSWVVPGLLEEKCLALLKKLPKHLRKHLVPLPDTVKLLLDSMQIGKGSLYQALEQAIQRHCQLKIRRQDWQANTLPPHLRMRYQIVDGEGTILLVSRSWQEVLAFAQGNPVPLPVAAGQAQRPPDRGSMQSFDYTPIPERWVSHHDHQTTCLYPSLCADEQKRCVHLRWLADATLAREGNREGLRLLYGLSFTKEIKALRAECKATLISHSASWLALDWLPGDGKRDRALLDFLLDDIFSCRNGKIPEPQEAQERIRQVQEQGLLRQGKAIIDLVTGLLAQRREAGSRLSAWLKLPGSGNAALFALLARRLQEILPADFLVSRTAAELVQTPRYLRGFLLRLERARLSPAKDQLKEARLLPVRKQLHHLQSLPGYSQACLELIREFRHMAAELELSVFAPEIGTIMPVSEKRLEKKWQEVEASCHAVE